MWRTFRNILLVVLVVVLGVAIYYYAQYRKAGVPADLPQSVYVTIPTNSTFEAVVDTLQQHRLIGNEQVFRFLANRMSYNRDKMRAGRYRIDAGWTPIKLIRTLRNGPQAPVEVVLTTEREPVNVAAKAARFIEADSTAIADLLLSDAFVDSLGYTRESLMSLFIPNTYEFYWNTTARGFVERMVKEHDRFWTPERLAQAKAKGLSTNKVYTLASIVEKETLLAEERRRMAGVYLNRLKKNMLLQADPTSVFATRDFETSRVTNYHTEFDSPYNTYRYPGLPPGPIAMASISSLEAVLRAEDHEYIYFCAAGDGSSRHNFAETYNQHLQNIKIYKQNLRDRGLL